MALSPAEKQKRYRQRQKQAERAAPDLAASYLSTPFFRWLGEGYERADWMEVGIDLNAAGFAMPDFDDDSGPQPAQGGPLELVGDWWKPYEGYSDDSIGRAESIINYLLAAANTLTFLVNKYKLEEIEARIAEIEKADLSDPAMKAKALEDIVALKAIKARLDGKTFRRSFAEFSVKGNVST